MITDTDCGDESAGADKNDGSVDGGDESENENQEEDELYGKIDE